MRSGYSKAPVDDNSIPLIQNTYNTGAGGVGSGAGSSRLSRADPMDRFRRYEEDFLNSSRIISRGLKQLDNTQGNVDSIISVSAEVDSEVTEAEAYLKAMDTEWRGLLGSDKKAAGTKVTDYREEYRQIVENFKAARAKAEATALKGGNAAREKLLNANQKLDRSTAALEQSRMLVAQTEGIGSTITTDLESQREVLQSAKNKVQETKQFTYDAKGILKVMSRRNVYHKLILIAIILALFAAIITTGYFGFIKKKK